MSENQAITQPKNKYFHMMLNMADDDLDVYEYRLLGHYIRVGETFEGTRTTAKKTKMSLGKVVSTRNALEQKGYIRMDKPETQADTVKVHIVDRMRENIERYCSPDEHPVQDMNTRRSPDERKKNTEKKNHKVEPIAAIAGKIIKPQEHLATAMGTTLVKGDWSNYGKVTKTLIESGISIECFGEYVVFVRKLSAKSGNWPVTVNSLTANGRMSEYITQREKYQVETKHHATGEMTDSERAQAAMAAELKGLANGSY